MTTDTFVKGAKSIMVFWPLVVVVVGLILGWAKFEARTSAVEKEVAAVKVVVGKLDEKLDQRAAVDVKVGELSRDIDSIKRELENIRNEQARASEGIGNKLDRLLERLP